MRYELLFLDRAHRVAERFPFVAPDDAEAQGAAEDLNECAERELWCGRRIVKRWQAPHHERATDTD
jgi:hypothetical protein